MAKNDMKNKEMVDNEMINDNNINDEIVESELDFDIDENVESFRLSDEEILYRLMNASTEVHSEVKIDRIGSSITVRSIPESRYQKIRKECTTKIIKSGVPVEKFDSDKMNEKLLDYCIIKPNVSEQLLRDNHFSSRAKFFKAYLLPGELMKVVNKIAECSGFDEADEIEIKNV